MDFNGSRTIRLSRPTCSSIGISSTHLPNPNKWITAVFGRNPSTTTSCSRKNCTGSMTGGIVNNWVPALGFRWKLPGFLGSTRFDAFGVMSGLLEGDNTGGTQYGGG